MATGLPTNECALDLSAQHSALSARRFPPPWSVEELEACFIVLDASGQKLGYFYFEEESGRKP